MRAQIRVKRLRPTAVRAFVLSIDNEDINDFFQLKVAPEVHSQMMKHYNFIQMVEIENGSITQFHEVRKNAEGVVIRNKFQILAELFNKDLERNEVVKYYAELLNCSTRTAQRHVKDFEDVSPLSSIVAPKPLD